MSEDTAASPSTIRVLHVMDTVDEGGAEQNLLTLVRTLPPPQVEHHIAWLYESRGALEGEFRAHAAGLHPLRSAHGLGHFAAARALADVIREVRPHVLHAKLIRAQIVARLARMLVGGLPIITTWECVSYEPTMYQNLGRKGPVLRELTRVLDAATGIADTNVIAVSKQVAEHNARKLWFPTNRVTVVYNAADPTRVVELTDDAKRALRASLGLTARGPIILSVGRLVEQKSHDTTIEAMPAVLRRFPDAVLLIAGEGYDRPMLERLVSELDLASSVKLLGARKDVPELLQLADLFAFPSIYEGLGIALMEALAAGLPAASSSIPTSFEIADGAETVQYFETRNPHSMAATLVRMLESIDTYRASARRRAPEVIARFSAEHMSAGFMDVVRRSTPLLGATSSGARAKDRARALARRVRDDAHVGAALRAPFVFAKQAGIVLPRTVYQHLPFKGDFDFEIPELALSVRMRAHGHSVENALYWEGVAGMEPESLVPFAHFARSARVVLDIGANTGVYSLVASAAAPTAAVHAFEPVARIATLARGNVALNTAARISVHELAIGAEHGFADIYDPGGDNAYSASLNGAFLAGPVEKYPVRITTVDQFVEDEALSSVDLVKLDVEGFEEFALAGMASTIERFMPVLFLEFLPDREQHRPLVERIEWMLALGYRLYQLGPCGLTESPTVRAARDGVYNVLLSPPSKIPSALTPEPAGRQ